MKKFTPAERRQLKLDGYTDEEILRMEMESEGEGEMEMEEELATNSENMQSIPWDELRAAGQPEPKRTGMMNTAKKVRK